MSDSSVNSLDSNAVSILHWFETVDDTQGEIIKTTIHELQEDSYGNYGTVRGSWNGLRRSLLAYAQLKTN